MGRKKIKITPITDNRVCMATFHKRRFGLMKKAHELSVLCNCDIALVIISNQNRLYQYISNPPSNRIFERAMEIPPEENYTNQSMTEYIQRRLKRYGSEDSSSGQKNNIPNNSLPSQTGMSHPHNMINLFRNSHQPSLINNKINENILNLQNHKGQSIEVGSNQMLPPVDFNSKVAQMDLCNLGTVPYTWNYQPNNNLLVNEVPNYINNQNFAIMNPNMNNSSNMGQPMDHWKGGDPQALLYNVDMNNQNHHNSFPDQSTWQLHMSQHNNMNMLNFQNGKEDRQFQSAYRDQSNFYQNPPVNIHLGKVYPQHASQPSTSNTDPNPLRFTEKEKELNRENNRHKSDTEGNKSV